MFKTADLCDAHYDNGNIQISHPVFSDFGGLTQFSGEVRTVQCFEDNSKVREMVSSEGGGCILVVNAGASQRCAMLGDILAGKAVENGWSGIIMNGYVRDSAEIATMQLGIKALGTMPLKSLKKGEGSIGVTIAFAGMRYQPGNYVYADEDGIICSSEALL